MMTNRCGKHKFSVIVKFNIARLGIIRLITIFRLSLSTSYEHRRSQNFIYAKSLGLDFAHWVTFVEQRNVEYPINTLSIPYYQQLFVYDLHECCL